MIKILKNKHKIIFFILILILIATLFFSYGLLYYKYKIPPSNFVSYFDFTPKDNEEDQFSGYISKLITIRDETDVTKKRNALIKYIWKQEKLSLTTYPVIEENIIDKRYSGMKNLKQINKLIVSMDYNVSSVMYHFYTTKPNNNLIIYHQGHKGDFIKGYSAIDEFLNNGYDVIAISMPLIGMNNQPEIEVDEADKIKLTTHKQFALLDNKNFSSIKFFIEPVMVAVNYAQQIGYAEVDMVGISGGGWTTVLSSAVDPRISKSYPVAGSYPLYLRFMNKDDWGDYEQVLLSLYKTINYLELYILGSYGEARKQTQVFNVYDSCCYAGHRYKSYENIIYQRIQALGKGDFTVFADATHREHKISKTALKFIIDDLKKQ